MSLPAAIILLIVLNAAVAPLTAAVMLIGSMTAFLSLERHNAI